MMTLMIMTLMNLLGSGGAELLEQLCLLRPHVLVPVDGVQDKLHLSLSRHLAARCCPVLLIRACDEREGSSASRDLLCDYKPLCGPSCEADGDVLRRDCWALGIECDICLWTVRTIRNNINKFSTFNVVCFMSLWIRTSVTQACHVGLLFEGKSSKISFHF